MGEIPPIHVIELLMMFVDTVNLAYCKDNARSPSQNDKIAIPHFFAESPQVSNFLS